MKESITQALATADTLADFVSAGLADNLDQQELAKQVAVTLKKLIVDATEFLDKAEPLTKLDLPSPNKRTFKRRAKSTWQHPNLMGGKLTHRLLFEVKDIKEGKRKDGSPWVKTHLEVVREQGAKFADTKFVTWNRLRTSHIGTDPDGNDVRALSEAFIGDILELDFKVDEAIEKGGQFNKTFHEVVIKPTNKDDIFTK